MASTTAKAATGNHANDDAKDAQAILHQNRSNEIWLGVVGPVGAGGSHAIKALEKACGAAGYKVETIKMSSLIRDWAVARELSVPPEGHKTLESVETMQNLGDHIRKRDPAGVARLCLAAIAAKRAEKTGRTFTRGEVVEPDQEKRAYLIDSIRHPAETSLFRRAYGNAFALVGVVCREDIRRERIIGKYLNNQQREDPAQISMVDQFIARDADDSTAAYGQHVTSAFHEADFFIDNSEQEGADQRIVLEDELGRLVGIITHSRIIRPTIEETAMHHAHSARVRSACLSRQVGAALVDADGTVVSTGTNEVPKAGGGIYGEHFSGIETPPDHRCAFRPGPKICSSNVEQNRIIDELIDALPALQQVEDQAALRARIRKTRLGGLIEFSRAVHAEMDALLSAGREGVSTIGTRLFVTTFPCHYCARHIVSAGVYEVQFIEPYPKSLALALHVDAIAVEEDSWMPPEEISAAEEKRRAIALQEGKRQPEEPGRVLFKPFVGVAPRLYLRAFEKTRDLKEKVSGEIRLGTPAWGDEWSPFTSAYPELEAALTKTLP
ncbi:anti-phage dCTP deaminase [Sphingomonas crocodyli]|uniref:Deoxycytidylate deaminase n=1 Tax=Sphingomonas crocodyli TaxID=1979270 RepID=A0A437M613_9SPHN|nr:anti-phage dCTP deaminase [Sphingomonas crocodyli]RVT93122.1 deoxycytidylate deaminase [Sphingomonas crocodyli]